MKSKTTTTVLMIGGMRSNKCREKITAAFESVVGVKNVDVNLYRAQAIIIHEPLCESADLVQTAAASGYAAEPIMEPGEAPDERCGEVPEE